MSAHFIETRAKDFKIGDTVVLPEHKNRDEITPPAIIKIIEKKNLLYFYFEQGSRTFFNREQWLTKRVLTS